MLVSSIERIGSVDPLSVLERLVERALVDDRIATLVEQGRAYWARPRDAFAIAAIGAVATLHPAGADRFSAVDDGWRSIISDAVIQGADAARGVGPILIGGFAFDPSGSRSETWSGFPASHLILPRVVVSSVDGATYITINRDDADPRDDGLIRTVMSEAVMARSRFDDVTQAVTPVHVQDLTGETEWKNAVATAVSAIRSGDLDKVVLARAERVRSQSDFDAFATLRHLQVMHRDSFVFAYWRGDRAFVGASPERLVSVDGNTVQASSLAGTIPRGLTADEDRVNAETLTHSRKDLMEHAAVRNALYDALSTECEGVTAPAEPSLMTLPHVHHLHTEIRGHLREGRTILGVAARLHPTPAVGGSPRDKALDFIRANEGLDRGWYASPIGWVGRDGGDFAVGLRSAVIDGSDATLFAGCGIVADSDPGAEFAESTLKLQLMESALAVSSREQAELTSAAERAT
jgi:isochorismate synthase